MTVHGEYRCMAYSRTKMGNCSKWQISIPYRCGQTVATSKGPHLKCSFVDAMARLKFIFGNELILFPGLKTWQSPWFLLVFFDQSAMPAMPAMPRAVRMKTLQLEPSSITWNSLMSASALARDWRSALAM